MSRLGRYVGRARGGALRAAGVPRTPNLPSVRASVQRAVRGSVSSPLAGRRASPAGSSGGGGPTRQKPFGGLAALLGFVAVVIVIYLLAHDAPAAPTVPRDRTCADRVVWHGARLSDC